ncbi:hypothetical protein ACJ41O_014853 [Fusarium nematophilum]
MDPFSITVGCLGLIDAIHKTSSLITRFIVNCKEARGDLRAVNLELSDLTLTVHLLQDIVSDDGKAAKGSIPGSLESDIRGIIDNCLGVARDIEDVLAEYTSGRLAPTRWAVRGKDRVTTLKTLLGAHRQALNLAVDTITLAIAKDIKKDTGQIVNDTADIKEDTSKILDEIARLEALIVNDPAAPAGNRAFMLKRFLDDMTTVAGTVCDDLSRPGSPTEFSFRDTANISHRTQDQRQDPEKNPRNPGMPGQNMSTATHQRAPPKTKAPSKASYKMDLVAENVGPFQGQMLSVSFDGTTAFSWDQSKKVVMQDVSTARVRGTWKPWSSLSMLFNSSYAEVLPLSRDGSLVILVEHTKKNNDWKLRVYDWVLEAEVHSLDLNTHINIDYFPTDENRVLFTTWKRSGGLDMFQVERVALGGGYEHQIRTGTLPDDDKSLASGYPWASTFSQTGQRVARVFLKQTEAWVDCWDIGSDPLPRSGGMPGVGAPKRTILKRNNYWLTEPYNPPSAVGDPWPSVEYAGDTLAMVGCAYDRASDTEGWYVTGWNLGSGDIVFHYSLGTWPSALVFRARLSGDCRRLAVMRWTRFEDEDVFDRTNVDSAEWATVGEWKNYELLDVESFRTIRRWRGSTKFNGDLEVALNQARGGGTYRNVYKLARDDGVR